MSTNIDSLRTSTEKFRVMLNSTAPRTAASLAKLLDFGRDLLPRCAGVIAERSAQVDARMLNGTREAIKFAEEQLADAELDLRQLKAHIAAVEKEIPALRSKEEAAITALQNAEADVLKRRAAFVVRLKKEYTPAAKTLASLLREERELRAATMAAMQARVYAPPGAFAAVATTLGPFTPFARGAGANTLDESIKVLLAVADPDAPDAPSARHWPPVVVAPPAPPPEPRPAAEPYERRGRTVVHPGAPTPPAAATHIGPRGMRPDNIYADAAARALA